MGSEKKFNLKTFLIRFRSWEFWPFEIAYFPVFFYWAWLSAKARSFFFCVTANPGIENGGWMGETKMKIMDKIPEAWKPKTIFIQVPAGVEQVLSVIEANRLSFPVIAKPDIGERGWKVEKINSKEELELYCNTTHVNFLIQEYLDYPLEAGVFYFRFPNEETGRVSSIVLKDFLSVTGDGKSTLEELIENYPRARLHRDTLIKKYYSELTSVLPPKERFELVCIGNHARGTTFLNGNYLITPQLNHVFDDLSKKIEGFYFGRYDIRFEKMTDLYEGKFKIMELNGSGAEPGHIYDPKLSVFAAYKSIFYHISVLYHISELNRKNGYKHPTTWQGLEILKKVRLYNKLKTH